METGAAPAGSHPPQILLPHPDPPPLAPRDIWEFRDLLLFLVFVPFALLASKIVMLLGYAALRPFTRWRMPVDLVQADTLFLLVQQCFFYVFILGFLFLLARFQHQQPFWKSLGWKNPSARQVVSYLAGGGELAIAASLLLLLLPDSQGFPLEKLFDSRTASFAIGAFAITVAPVIEEVVFRGLLFAIFERAAGMRFAVVVDRHSFCRPSRSGILARLESHDHDSDRRHGVLLGAWRNRQSRSQHHPSHRVQLPHHGRALLFHRTFSDRDRHVGAMKRG